MKKVKVAEKIKNNSPFASFANVVRHFFPNLTDWLDGMDDPRHASYIKYSQGILCGSLIMKDICGLESMQAMNKTFMMDESRGNLAFLFGDGSDTEAPHYQTINNWCKGVDPNELQEVLTKCVKALVAGKLFKDAMVDGEWLVILDASGYAKSDKKFSEHCLKKTRQGSDGKVTTWYECQVLAAFIVLGDGLAVPMMVEFIENESENVSKQDCELKAAKRLLPRLREAYPKLGICMLGDSLYCCEPFMRLCRELGMSYILRLKEDRQKSITEAFREQMGIVDGVEKVEVKYRDEKGTAYFLNGTEELVKGKTEKFNMMVYVVENGKGDKEKKEGGKEGCESKEEGKAEKDGKEDKEKKEDGKESCESKEEGKAKKDCKEDKGKESNKKGGNESEKNNDKAKNNTVKKFIFVTCKKITKKNASVYVSGGRSRWLIENKGFKDMKCSIFQMEHLCCGDYNAMKVHLLLKMLALMLMGLFMRFDGTIVAIKYMIKDAARLILIKFTGHVLTEEEKEMIGRRKSFHRLAY